MKKPEISERARIGGNGITQLFLTSLNPLTFLVTRNEQVVSGEYIAGLVVNINPASGEFHGVLSYKALKGQPARQENLFPGAFAIFGAGRRLEVSIGYNEPNYVLAGQSSAGMPMYIEGGLTSISVLIEDGIFATRAQWEDGLEEEIIPTGPLAIVMAN